MAGSVQYHEPAKRWYIQIKGSKLWRDCDTFQPFLTKARALKYLSIAQQQIDRGEFNPDHWKPDSPVLVKNLFEQWIDAKEASAKTLRDYRGYMINHVIPEIGDRDGRYIKASDLRKIYVKLQKKLSQKAIYNIMSALRTMYRDLYRDEVLFKVPPFPKLTNPVNKKTVEYLTIDQQEKIISEIPKEDRPIFEFGMEYGLRTQEARAMQWDCFEHGKVIIKRAFADNTLSTTKTDEEHIPGDLTEYAKEILERVKGFPVRSPIWVFVRQKDGKPYTNKNLNKIWHAAEKKAGVSCKLQNAMRHSLGCQLLDMGKPRSLVQSILGHKSENMTRRYAKHSQPIKTDALEGRRTKVVDLNSKKAVSDD